MNATRIAPALGLVALALILGALGFEYLAGFPPCEMCMWQRWPLYAAIVAGLAGSFVFKDDARWIAAFTILLVGASGAIGFYQAGVEWHYFPGPEACTGTFHPFNGLEGLNAPGAVRCDVAAWRLFGISLAGYNAVISLGSALAGLVLLVKR